MLEDWENLARELAQSPGDRTAPDTETTGLRKAKTM